MQAGTKTTRDAWMIFSAAFPVGTADRVFLFVNPPLDTEPAENTRDALLTNLNIQFESPLRANKTRLNTDMRSTSIRRPEPPDWQSGELFLAFF